MGLLLLLELLRGVLLGRLLVLLRGMLGLLRVMGLLRVLGLALVALDAHSGESMLSVLKRLFLVLGCDPGE